MTTIFVSGSMKIKKLDKKVVERIDNMITSEHKIILGDANGIDSSIQEYLAIKKYQNVTIYCSGNQPRNNIGRWPLKSITTNFEKGSREFFTAKDIEMTKESDFGFMIWDTQSTGTLSNVFRMMLENKKSLVFINKNKEFITVNELNGFEILLDKMSEKALLEADKKIGILRKINAVKQGELFNQ